MAAALGRITTLSDKGVALTHVHHEFMTHDMSKMIQLRHVPDALHRLLKARAAQSDLSLSNYLIREFRKIAERPTLDVMRARLQGRKPPAPR
jgi:hypothetical protein